jgi:hypothetical protein
MLKLQCKLCLSMSLLNCIICEENKWYLMTCSMFFPIQRNFGPFSNLQIYGKVATDLIIYWAPKHSVSMHHSMVTAVLTLRGQALLYHSENCVLCMAVNVWDISSYQLAMCQQPQCNVFLLHWVLKLIYQLYAPKQRHNINAFQEQLVQQHWLKHNMKCHLLLPHCGHIYNWEELYF